MGHVDIRTLPGFTPALTTDERIALAQAYYAQRETSLTEADEAAIEAVLDLEDVAQQSRNCLPLQANPGQARVGAQADVERAFRARLALSPAQQAAYLSRRQARAGE